MNEERQSRWDQVLDLLAEEVAERLGDEGLRGQRRGAAPEPPEARETRQPSRHEADKGPEAEGKSVDRPEPEPHPEPKPKAEPVAEPTVERQPEVPGEEPEPGPSFEPPVASHTARLLGRLALGLLALVVVINIPINRHGTTLATAMPDRRALIFRDGLVVKEEDDPEIYVYEDGAFRWISSLKAFEMRGYAWEDVHVVEDGFLDEYTLGPPIHVILQCRDSPHVYRLEGEEKRWIVDIEAFEAEGYVWEDVQFVSCSYLRSLPDGETIPPGHGPPPQP